MQYAGTDGRFDLRRRGEAAIGQPTAAFLATNHENRLLESMADTAMNVKLNLS